MSETNPEPAPVTFNLKPVKSKPKRKYRKGSKYDPLLEAFMSGSENLVAVTVPEKDANYLRTQLNKRIDALPKVYKNIAVSVANNTCYLERVTE
jgi:hypothetical protein